MRKVLITALLAFPIAGFAQEKIKKKIALPHSPYQEEFEVLKKAPTTRHGSYKSTLNEKTIEYGSYKNGLKDSVWVTFSEETGAIIEKGIFSNGIKTGIWEKYNKAE